LVVRDDFRARRPLLYQVNTRVLLGERGRAIGRPATLDDLPDSMIDEVAARGFEWVWFLGVWTTGDAARAVSRSRRDWRTGFARNLPDLRDEDISGSPFAIQAYDVSPEYGGDAALARLRERLTRRGLRLLLDFVPNHVSPDHRWVSAHPEYLIEGTEADLAREPSNWTRPPGGRGRVLACGRDPYFPGWPDTVQLNYVHGGLREAMRRELARVAELADGVRCDMAMLVLPDVFRRTWGDRALPRDATTPVEEPFWPEAIARVRRVHPGFLFMAEVYWDLEWTLQQQGFDFTYDKRLYDRLRAGDARSVREHLWAVPEFQERSARFLENHDEPRAASVFPPEQHRAAAAIAFVTPGLRFFHEGQLDGRRVHVSMHLGRRPDEPPDPALGAYYERLLRVLRRQEVHAGRWSLCECREAWSGNPTWDRFVVMAWDGGSGSRLLVAVNYGPTRAQCWAKIPFTDLAGLIALRDLLGEARYEREAVELSSKGLYLDLPPWGVNAFSVEAGAAA
jgi:Alpha amylase, catalytic domain